MTALVVTLCLGNALGWVAVSLYLRRVGTWMRDEDTRDADLLKGFGRLRGELVEARDELRGARRLLDWATERLIDQIEDDPS